MQINWADYKFEIWLAFDFNRTVQAIAIISKQVHIIWAICFPPTSHCTYFNATAILSIVMHAYVLRKLQYFNTTLLTAPISIQLRSFQPIQPFWTNSNYFSLTAATFQSSCSFLNILLLLSRATCMHFKRSYYVEPTAVIFVFLHPFFTRPKRVCFCGRNTGHGTSFRKTHACVRQLPAGAMYVPRGTGDCRQERVRTAVICRKYVGTGVRSKKERVMAEKQPKSRSLKCMFY